MTTTSSISTTTSSSVNRSGLTVSEAVDLKLSPLLTQISDVATKISTNETKIAYYEAMQNRLQTLQTAADALRSIGDTSSSVFAGRSTTMTSDTSAAASSILSADVSDGTGTGTHEITVTQLAKAERIATTTSQSSRSTALGLSGSFTLGEASGTAATISLTSDMTLDNIVAAINAKSSSTGVTASVLAVSSTSYTLVLTGNDDNQAINLSTLEGSSLSSLGLTQSDGSTVADILQAPQPALISVDGITNISRNTNDISDVIDGMTLHLLVASPSTTLTVQTTIDSSKVTDAVSALVDAYNSWRSFVAANEATNSDGTAASTAILWGDSTLRETDLAIDRAITSLVGTMSLGAAGVSLTASNTLSMSTTTLETALQDNYSAFVQLFGGSSTATGIAETLYSVSKSIGASAGSALATIVSNLEITDSSLQSREDLLNQQYSDYQTFLLTQYGNLEAAISANNQTVSILNILLNNTSSSTSS